MRLAAWPRRLGAIGEDRGLGADAPHQRRGEGDPVPTADPTLTPPGSLVP